MGTYCNYLPEATGLQLMELVPGHNEKFLVHEFSHVTEIYASLERGSEQLHAFIDEQKSLVSAVSEVRRFLSFCLFS